MRVIAVEHGRRIASLGGSSEGAEDGDTLGVALLHEDPIRESSSVLLDQGKGPLAITGAKGCVRVSEEARLGRDRPCRRRWGRRRWGR